MSAYRPCNVIIDISGVLVMVGKKQENKSGKQEPLTKPGRGEPIRAIKLELVTFRPVLQSTILAP